MPARSLRAAPLRLAVATLGLVLVASAVLLAVRPPAAPAQTPTRTVTITPADELGNQVVEVAWSGFRPSFGTPVNFGVKIYQCTAVPASLADCNNAREYPDPESGNRVLTGRTAQDGTGSALIEVRPTANDPTLACSESNPCSILVFETGTGEAEWPESTSASVIAPIRFAKSQADCPAVDFFDVRADGSASAAPAMYRWAAELCGDGEGGLDIDFTETSSTTGRENFLAGLVDLGVTPVPPTEEELAAHPEHPDYLLAPIDATAVTVVFNITDPRTGARIERLVLSQRLVARIITDSDLDTFFNDIELRLLNPGVSFPGVFARPLLRSERDADTTWITSWMLTSNDSTDFLADRDRFGRRLNGAYRDYVDEYPTDVFEKVDVGDDAYLPRTGQTNIGLRAFYGVRPAGSVRENTALVGFIGVVDLPTARRLGLPTAEILNSAADPVPVPPDADALQAGLDEMTLVDGMLRPTFDTDARAYPLVKVDYAMVPTRVLTDGVEDDAKAEAIVRLLRFAADEGQDLLPDGYVPLPDELRAQTRLVAAALERQYAATTTTTSPATTTPTTSYVPPYTYGTGGGFDDPVTTVATPTTAAGARTTTTTSPATTTTIAPFAALPVGGERLALPVMMGLGGVGMIGWAGAGLAARLTPRRRRSGRSGPPRLAGPSGGATDTEVPSP